MYVCVDVCTRLCVCSHFSCELYKQTPNVAMVASTMGAQYKRNSSVVTESRYNNILSRWHTLPASGRKIMVDHKIKSSAHTEMYL